jgi:hypothetical protein
MKPLFVVTSVRPDGRRVPLDGESVDVVVFERRSDADRVARICRQEDKRAGCDTAVKVVRFEAVLPEGDE